MSILRSFPRTVLLLPVLALGCGEGTSEAPLPQIVEEQFAFDGNLEGWAPAATDTLDPRIEWAVRHTTEHSFLEDGSVEFFMDNLNDAGKIWMERSFELEPGVPYTAEIAFALGSSDWGDLNHFTLITGVHASPPREADDLAFQGDTGNGQDEPAGVVWTEKGYSFPVEAPADGDVHVAIGVWGTWETARTYYVDAVTIRFVPDRD